MAVGDDALDGTPEEFEAHYFPSDTKKRKIWFKGHYLSIYNEKTSHNALHIDNSTPSTEHADYEVPAGYAVYVRGANVYFTA